MSLIVSHHTRVQKLNYLNVGMGMIYVRLNGVEIVSDLLACVAEVAAAGDVVVVESEFPPARPWCCGDPVVRCVCVHE